MDASKESSPLILQEEADLAGRNFSSTRAALALLPVFFVFSALGHVLIGVSETVWVFYVGLTIGSTSVVCNVLLKSLVSLETSQGLIFLLLLYLLIRAPRIRDRCNPGSFCPGSSWWRSSGRQYFRHLD